MDGKKVAQHSDAELAAGVNLAAAVLEAGPDRRASQRRLDGPGRQEPVPPRSASSTPSSAPRPTSRTGSNLTPEEIEAKRQAVWQKRLAEYRAMEEALRQAMAPRPHAMEIVPAH